MAKWSQEVALFFSDMFRHTVGKLSGSLSILIGLAPIVFPAFFAGDRGLLHARWVFELAAAIAFFLAAHSAWSEQYRKAMDVQQKLNDKRPRIALSVTNRRASMWRYGEGPALFSLNHLGGDAARFLQIQPIRSAQGKNLWVRFEQVDFLDDARKEAHPDFSLDIGGRAGGGGPDKTGNLQYVFFKRDGQEHGTVDYRVTVKFMWNEEWLEEDVTLRWHTSTETLTTHPVESGESSDA